MNDSVCRKEDQIQNPNEDYGHLVILGAGASKACCDDKPEKNGKSIPLMDDLSKFIDLEPFLSDISEEQITNFEKLFSELHIKERNSDRVQNIENAIHKYFSSLQLPDTPTIYDYLVLSLRKKDVIATFNWDPFLVQAYLRNSRFTTNLPNIIFLHGNVAVGFDDKTERFGQIVKPTSYNQAFKPTKLLYPVEKKDYNADPFIKSQWDCLLQYLDSAMLITIFGYSAPVTDVEARDLMSKVWGIPERDRYMPEIEIINIDAEETVNETWRDFLHSHHFSHITSFFDERSWLYNFPRRTGEMFGMRYIEGEFQEENRPPKFETINEMWEWYSELTEAEPHPEA